MKKQFLVAVLAPVFLLGGCFGDKPKDEKKVILGESKKPASFMNEYNAEGNWLVLQADGRRGVQHYIISKGDGNQRLVELNPKGGYIVHKIKVSCERKGIFDLGGKEAKVAKMDMMPPVMPAPKKATIPEVEKDIDKICGNEEKDIIRGPLSVAVRLARSKELNLQEIRQTIRPMNQAPAGFGVKEERVKMPDGTIIIKTTPNK
jgi:hypothetical protein